MKELAWTMKPFPPLVSPEKRNTPEAHRIYLEYAVEAVREGTKYADFYQWAVGEGLNKNTRFFAALLNAFKSKQWDKNGQWATTVEARLVEVAMEPYKPRNGPRRLKNDPEHRMTRQAYKKRTVSDKKKAALKDKQYYKKNRNQLLQRHKRSAQLHKRPETAVLASVLRRLVST